MAEQMAHRDTDMETVIEGKVYPYLEEKDEREREKRECNIILHNIPESVSDDLFIYFVIFIQSSPINDALVLHRALHH